MKKKIVGICICMLMIAVPVVSATGATIHDNILFREITKKYDSPIQQIASKNYDPACIIQLTKLTAPDSGIGDDFGYSVSIDGNYAIIGAPLHDDPIAGMNAGAAYIFYRCCIGHWELQQTLTAYPNPVTGGLFGWSVSISGDYALVGAVGEDAAYIFQRSDTSWTSAPPTRLSGIPYPIDYFGFSVSIDGDNALIGACEDNDMGAHAHAGAAYIFHHVGTNWIPAPKLHAEDPQILDFFGQSVSISGDYAVIGAYLDDNEKGNDAGGVYIFDDLSGSWLLTQPELLASDGWQNDQYGVSISINGPYLIVGAHLHDTVFPDDGEAYIYHLNSGGSWTEVQKLKASDPVIYDNFGYSVSISEDCAIVGTYLKNIDTYVNSGKAYVFLRGPTGTWRQVGQLLPSDMQNYHYFGCSVSVWTRPLFTIPGTTYTIYQHRTLIGAKGDNNEGAAYLFTPGFEIIIAFGALAFIVIWKRKSKKQN